jgi:DnaJ-class molecular chaperone
MEDEFWFEDESWFEEERIENMEETTERTVCPICGGSGSEDDGDVCFMCFGHGFIES